MHSQALPERRPDPVKAATKNKDSEVEEGGGEGEMELASMKW